MCDLSEFSNSTATKQDQQHQGYCNSKLLSSSLHLYLAANSFLGLQVAQSYGLLLGTIVMIPKTAQTLAAIIMLTFILTGG